MKNLFHIILLFSAILAFFSNSFAQDSGKKINLKWREVPKAKGYMVQIKNDKDKIIIQETTLNNNISIGIASGKYLFRIGALNKFFKVALWSDWVNLKIKSLPPPIISSISPNSVNIQNKGQRIIIKGKNFISETEIGIESYRRKIPIEKKEIIDKDTIELTIDTSDVLAGKYSVTLTNPGNKVSTKEDAFSINPPVAPTYFYKNKNNFISIGLMPQLFFYEIQTLNSVFPRNTAISLDIYIDSLKKFSLVPGVRFGYFSSLSKIEPKIGFTGYRTDIFLSANIYQKKDLYIFSNFGIGLSIIEMESDYSREGGRNQSFKEGNLFVSLESKYQIFRYLSLSFGIEYFSLLDTKGKTSFFTPRIGMIIEY